MEKIENVRTTKAFDPDTRYQDGGAVEADKPAHALDSDSSLSIYHKLEDWFEQERSLQAENRYQMALDQDFYDGQQYSEEDAAELEERGQAPLVYNEIKPTIDWVVGTERRTKFDFNVLPRSDDDVEMASIKRDVMKYISDVNRLPFERSQCFKEMSICGLSWMDDGVRGDNDDDPLYSSWETWRNVWYDSNSKKLDLSDARYLFRRKAIDLDMAKAMFPDRVELLAKAALDADSFQSHYDDDFYMGVPLRQNANGTTPINSFTRHAGIGSSRGSVNRRQRVELIEAWTRDPAKVQRIRGDLFNGETYDPANPAHVKANDDGVISLFDALEMQINVHLFCAGGLLWSGPSPYKHKRFGLTPMWCYRRGRDNAPYGLVRNIRDPQEDLNRRASKALFILSSNQVVADEGAVEDWETLRDEASRPDGVIVKKSGKILEFRQDKALAEEHIMLMDRDGNAIRNAGGVTDENLGRGTNAQSGKAILARQTQGSVVTAEVFDNYLLAFQIQGENILSLAEQFYSAPKVIRLTGSKKGALSWRKINQPQPDGSYLNDITETKADFLVDEQDYRENIRQAMFEQMMEMVSRMPPELAINLLDLVFEFSDLQGKDEIVKRIREINGKTSPDEEMSPEQQAKIENQKQMEAAAAEMAQRTAEAQVKTLEAKVAQMEAQTKKLDADRLTAMVTAMYEALQSGQIVATIPNVAPVADEILRGAGYQPQPGGVDPNIPTPPETPAPAVQPLPELQQADGAQRGIQTPGNDGVM